MQGKSIAPIPTLYILLRSDTGIGDEVFRTSHMNLSNRAPGIILMESILLICLGSVSLGRKMCVREIFWIILCSAQGLLSALYLRISLRYSGDHVLMLGIKQRLAICKVSSGTYTHAISLV